MGKIKARGRCEKLLVHIIFSLAKSVPHIHWCFASGKPTLWLGAGPVTTRNLGLSETVCHLLNAERT